MRLFKKPKPSTDSPSRPVFKRAQKVSKIAKPPVFCKPKPEPTAVEPPIAFEPKCGLKNAVPDKAQPIAFAEPRVLRPVHTHKHEPRSLAALIATAALGLRVSSKSAFAYSAPLERFSSTACFANGVLVLNPRKLVVRETNWVYKLRDNVYVLVEDV